MSLPHDRTAERRALRVANILDQALAIVEAEGLDGLTLNRLAQALGLVTTGLYRYFPSKDALVAALQRRSINVIHAHFREELVRFSQQVAGSTPATVALATLIKVADLYLALPASHVQEWRFVATLLGDPRQLLPAEEIGETVPILTSFLLEIEALFEQATMLEALAEGPQRQRVFAFWAALHGALCMEKLRRVSTSPDDVGGFVVRALLSSWGATPARLSAATRLATVGNRPDPSRVVATKGVP
jgi:AcrR family transcriptional regulator